MNTELQISLAPDKHSDAVLSSITETDDLCLADRPNELQVWNSEYERVGQKNMVSVFAASDFRSEITAAGATGSGWTTEVQSWLDAELAEKEYLAKQIRSAYIERIKDLRNYGSLEDIVLNKNSEKDFWTFIGLLSSVEAEIFLVDNGNLRAVWKGAEGSHLGLQFLGNRWFQYVIFRRRKGSRHVSRVAGRDTWYGIKKQLKAFELEALLCA